MSFPTAFLILGALAGSLVASRFGWISFPETLDTLMILVGFFGLIGVLKLPWDIYFEARGLVLDQEESARAGITVDADERAYAAKTSKRLLSLCVFTHLFAAALCASVSYVSGGKVGYTFAVFFLISTAFRPLGSFYGHMKKRLLELRKRARYPREDVLNLVSQVKENNAAGRHNREQIAVLQQLIEEHQLDATRLRERTERHVTELDNRQVALGQSFESKVDRVCREFENSIARLTKEKEILEGMRAFVRLVKES